MADLFYGGGAGAGSGVGLMNEQLSLWLQQKAAAGTPEASEQSMSQQVEKKERQASEREQKRPAGIPELTPERRVEVEALLKAVNARAKARDRAAQGIELRKTERTERTERTEQTEQKQRQVIDVVLADQPEAFKRAVFELCRQLGWPDDEPGFLLAVVSNRLYALAQEYPQQLTAAMQQATAGTLAQWQDVQDKLSGAAARQDLALAQMMSEVTLAQRVAREQVEGTQSVLEQALAQWQQVLARAQGEARAALEQERQSLSQAQAQVVALLEAERAEVGRLMAAERQAMQKQATAAAEQQKQVMEAYTKELILEVVAEDQQRARAQVKEIVSTVRRKHYVEAGFWAVAAAALMSVSVGTMAWVARGVAEDNSVWGDIERWNGDHLQACIEAQQTTCNFHIEVPDHPH